MITLFLRSSIQSQEKNLLEKTGQVMGEVTKKIAEPIVDPKAAFSYWFDFDPRIERGEKKNFNILPLFVSSPERGQGFGVKYAQESLWRKNDIIKIHAIQTLKGKSAYQLNYHLPPTLMTKAGGEIEIAYENYARFYYGIGNQSEKDNESEYTPEFFQAKIPFLYGISEKISLGFSLNFQNWKIVKIGSTGILPRDFPAFAGNENTRFFTPSLLFRWHTLNSMSNPSRGLFFQGIYEYSKTVLGSESDFSRTTLEARHFFPILQRDDHLFGIRLFLDYKSGDVPFYLLPELGGIFFNRGLIEGRFRDNLSITGNWEYRFKIYQRLHWAFFVDAGNVYNGFNSTGIAHTKITGGTGMRYYVPPGNLLLARVDGGYSTEGLQIYLTFDHPF